MPHVFDVSKKTLLDDPERWKYTDPYHILRKAGLRRGRILVDLGCGTGFFSVPASRVTGSRGQVISLDFQLDMLSSLKAKLKAEAEANLELMLSDVLAVPLRSASVNLVLMVDTFHEVERKAVFLREAWRILKPGSRIAVVDWKKVRMEIGPPWEERLTLDEVLSFLSQAGFRKSFTFEAGLYHYGVTAVKPKLSSVRI